MRGYGLVAAFPVALVVGFLAGFLGAIPPGPLGVTCLRKSLEGKRRDAYRVAFGGAIVDAFICSLIGLGLGWILEKVVTNPWVRGILALFLLGYGAKLLLVDARRDAEKSDLGPSRLHFTPAPAQVPEGRFRFPVLTGLLQGAANPALFVNWTLFISFLVGHRLLVPTPSGAGGFALGVGLGVFSWFASLIELVDRWRSRSGAWVSRSTLVAGALLVVFGLYFTWRSFTVP
ncbi:MAG TPA: LysE family transporter [Thermoanaerobaculia bacterium]|nr:LysE family transporter [Thermoanaerobaculia bacterium]